MGLIDPVHFRVIQTTANGKRGINFACVHGCDHIIVFFVAGISNIQITNAKPLQEIRDIILDQADDLSLLIGVTVGQIIFQISYVKRVM